MKGKTKTKFGKTKFAIERLCFEIFLIIFAIKEINDIFNCSYNIEQNFVMILSIISVDCKHLNHLNELVEL